jgi:hypothetical protein
VGVEFHSLRPYQAAPCGEANKALYCSNDLIFIEEFDMAYEKGCQEQLESPGETTFTCDPDYYVKPHNLYVTLDDSELPILGNTEEVKNSRNSGDTYDDATKVNEYVSWYLNGVNTRAEYGEPTNNQIVNFSGPLQKLLPGAIAEAQRATIIDSFDKKVTTTSEVDGSAGEDARNHNQTVVCADKAFQLPSWLSWLPIIGKVGFGESTAVPCYGGAKKYKLSSWRESNTLTEYIKDTLKDYVSKYLERSGNLAAQLVNKAFIDRWDKKMPPLPWSDKNKEPFKTSEAYQKAYNEWRGDLCALIPNIFGGKETLVCVGIPGVTNNEYADLFPYVPLAETPDKEGAEKIDAVQILPGGGTAITGEKYAQKLAPPLYFAHTEEVKQLSEILNKTYIPKGVTSVALPETTEKNECSVVNVRANPGDNLFPGDSSELQVLGVKYTIYEAPCHEVWPKTEREVCDPRCHKETDDNHTLECPADVTIKIKTSTLTPNADEIFSTTVADSASTFRKIYPKVEEGAPVSCIADMPTVTNVTYDAFKKPLVSEQPNGGVLSFKVKNIPEDGGNVMPQLTFPHLGSVYEYFLKGIQTALRPQGFGAPTPISADTCVSTPPIVCGELPENLPNSCGLGSISPRVGDIPDSLKKIVEAAASTYNTPPNLILGVMFGEGMFNQPPYQKYEWTEENVKNWATCEKMPNCSSGGGAINFGGNWTPIARAIAKDLKKLDPTRKDPDMCNLLDLVYGVSWTLHQSADGSPAFKNPSTGTGYTCLGHTLNTGVDIPSSCDWNDSQYESAIRIWEFGTGWGATSLGFYTCATKDNSCATGGGAAAQCPTDTAISPDTCRTSGNNSHNLCLWEVGHGN